MAGGLAIAGLLLAAAPAKGEVACGDVIGVHTPKNTKLTEDLLCDTNPALTVARGAQLNMRGFTVECDNISDDGIVLKGARAKLRNGIVTGCFDGVVVAGRGSHQIQRVTSTGNNGNGFIALDGSNGNRFVHNTSFMNSNEGYAVASDHNRFFNNTAADNQDGFLVDGGSGNIFVNNTSKENSNDGFDVGVSFDQSGGNDNRFINNMADNNNEDGFDVAANDNRFNNNDASGNAANGFIINDEGGSQTTGNRNRFRNNTANDNGEAGIAVFGTDNRITRNTALGNNVANGGFFDLFDNDPACDRNVWRRNTFDDAQPASCID
ncbi:MAG: right-handed parallel beta-helix repeat-containing protein [Pseudomonadota bacterium]